MHWCRAAGLLAGLFVSALCLAGCAPDAQPEQSQQPAAKRGAPSAAENFAAAAKTGDAANNEPADAFTPEEGFTRLTLADFDVFFAKKVEGSPSWTDAGGMIRGTGKPRGYLHSRKSYRNFTLRLDYRFPVPDDPALVDKVNTGVLVYISGPHRIWPVCLEVQGKHVEMGHIKANGRADVIDAAAVQDDDAARQKARKPVGEWNSLEIISRDGVLTSTLNGIKICENKAGELREGPLGLQAEDFAVEFRRLRIREDE